MEMVHAWCALVLVLGVTRSEHAVSNTASEDNHVQTSLELKDHEDTLTDGVDIKCNILLSAVVDGGHRLLNGSFLAPDGTLYPPGYFWRTRDTVNDSLIVTRACVCLFRPCLRKCCPNKHDTIGTDGNCTSNEQPTLQQFHAKVYHPVSLEMANLSETHFTMLYGNPCKNGRYKLEPHLYPGDQYFLLENGSLHTPGLDELQIDASGFCMEIFSDSEEVIPLLCFPEDVSPMDALEAPIYMMYPIGMIISEPFLLATFLVYAFIPELRNLHGKSLMSHVCSLFTAYLFLAIVQLGGGALHHSVCVASAFIILFSFFSCFFWLNVMCFDIWWTFSGFRPLRGSVKEREHKKFIIYSVYAWGSATVMLAISLVMELEPDIGPEYIKPHFGVKRCWFGTKEAELAYFFGPIGAIVFCNLVLFIVTAMKIVQLKRETAMLKGAGSMRHDEDENKQRFNLYLKLFVVMGVTWVMELISFAFGGPAYLWYITDLANTLQGVLIFMIFVWKDKIRRLLIKRFRPTMDGMATSHSSQSGVTLRTRMSPSRNNSSLSSTKFSMVSNRDNSFRTKQHLDESDVP